MARLVAGPHVLNANITKSFAQGTLGGNLELQLGDVIQYLLVEAKRVSRNDMSSVEAMLSSQAIALNALFGELVRRAGDNIGQYLQAAEMYMKMALRAQNQCRMTLETLSAIKNPPVVYAKQTNINNGGQQQVNNGKPSPRTGENEIPPNKKLEHSNEQRMDTGASAETVLGNPELAAVGNDQGT